MSNQRERSNDGFAPNNPLGQQRPPQMMQRQHPDPYCAQLFHQLHVVQHEELDILNRLEHRMYHIWQQPRGMFAPQQFAASDLRTNPNTPRRNSGRGMHPNNPDTGVWGQNLMQNMSGAQVVYSTDGNCQAGPSTSGSPLQPMPKRDLEPMTVSRGDDNEEKQEAEAASVNRNRKKIRSKMSAAQGTVGKRTTCRRHSANARFTKKRAAASRKVSTTATKPKKVPVLECGSGQNVATGSRVEMPFQAGQLVKVASGDYDETVNEGQQQGAFSMQYHTPNMSESQKEHLDGVCDFVLGVIKRQHAQLNHQT